MNSDKLQDETHNSLSNFKKVKGVFNLKLREKFLKITIIDGFDKKGSII